MGTAVSVAAIAAAIDHTKHRLPTPEIEDAIIIQQDDDQSPCSLDVSPCGLDASPCSLN